MHNRGEGDAAAGSREMSRSDFALIAPLVAVIVFLGVYPQFVLQRSEKSTTAQVQAVKDAPRYQEAAQR
jgi:NADH:ubiquinone oxidoreductase subunit 4 (subunit M)